MIGAENNEVLVTSQNISGTYAFNINDGGTISAKHYKIERVNADGVHLMAGSLIDAAPNNMSDGQFVGGAAGGRYLWLENNLENADDTVTISRVSFNTGARYNAKRRGASAQGVIQFEDAVGVVASYYFEDDDVDITRKHFSRLVDRDDRQILPVRVGNRKRVSRAAKPINSEHSILASSKRAR